MLARLLLAALLVFAPFARADAPPPPPIAAKAWLLYDLNAGQAIASQAPDERVEPASLTKLMTAYLVFQALKKGAIKGEQTAPVSERAWKAGGSRMFIEPRKPVTVDELLRGMIIQSGNDATIALAELVAGTEENFVMLMNKEGQRLGLKGTSFANSSGWPDPKHYSTARDLALLATAVIRDFPDFYGLYAVKEFRYNNITQPNRNRLLWIDQTVDGVKTGHTEAAGYCLIASAKRGPRRLVSVVLGTSSDAMRAQESLKLLNYGFQFYDSVRLYEKGQAISALKVWKGVAEEFKAGLNEELTVIVPKGDSAKLKAELVSQQPLVAPVQQGQRVGTVRVSLDGKPLAEYPAVALEAVPVAGFVGRTWDTIRLWFK
jgi:D-alanyl-D-alanine carboxypeptidase (penicillin-binding protein 5/6)